MLDEIIRRMEADKERRFTGKYFEGRAAKLRKDPDDLVYGLVCGYLLCLRVMGFITSEETNKALDEAGRIYAGEEQAG